MRSTRGIPADRVVCDRFGRIEHRAGSDQDCGYRCTGRNLADEAGDGTYYHLRRNYDATTSRLLTEDPSSVPAGDPNLDR